MKLHIRQALTLLESAHHGLVRCVRLSNVCEIAPDKAAQLLQCGGYDAFGKKSRVKAVRELLPLPAKAPQQDFYSGSHDKVGMPVLPPSPEWLNSRRDARGKVV